ncbi:HEPN domain-containing protein [Streptomyces sp. NPDC005840]|uniref:ApeA N-terminal domain 1-containing protein n=1 Tax=Streptomyces sp. NPDC005840 TaxID=3157072 RepID=UPI0033FDA6DB
MDKQLEALMSGVVGFFWPITEERGFDPEPERGFASAGSSRKLEIQTLNENPRASLASREKNSRPSAIVSLFPEGSAVFLNVSGRRETSNFGGRRASVYRYSARTVISGYPVEHLSEGRADIRVRELRAHFPGISHWAGLRVSSIDRERKSNDRLGAAILRLQSPDDVVADLGSLTLVIGGHWEIKNEDDRSSVYSPVSIGVKAKRARDITELLTVLLRVQNLVNVAYDTFVHVDGGIAVLGAEGEPDPFPRFWNDSLMEGPTGRGPGKGKRGAPLFDLADLKGAQGVSRWVRLHDTFPSAFEAVAGPYRFGGMTWHSYLRETAIGMERLIAASRRKGRPGWTAEKLHSYALARRIGAPFEEFVGDAKVWADLFWAAYNGGKHQADYEPESRDVATLGLSGNLLLTAYLLHRCGMPKSRLARMFQDRVSWQLRDRVRALVASPPSGLHPRSR